jgi:hypothetical protein
MEDKGRQYPHSIDELRHYGVLGMKWGIRKDRGSSASKTIRLANKDAKRYADAKMFYGKTAGTKRKLLKAELDRKKKTIDGYEDAFNKAVKDVDYAKSARKAVRTRKTTDAVYRARVTTKQVLSITGPLTVAAATAIYKRNKQSIDAFVVRTFNNIADRIR